MNQYNFNDARSQIIQLFSTYKTAKENNLHTQRTASAISEKAFYEMEDQDSTLDILLLLLLLLVGRYWVPRYLFKSLVLRPLWPIAQTPMIDEDDFWSNLWNENWQGKPKYSEKTYPSATLSTTKFHMRPDLEPRTAAVGSQRLTAWAMARPTYEIKYILKEAVVA
jgi:hypothetical protein